jgi:hypothetical protein
VSWPHPHGEALLDGLQVLVVGNEHGGVEMPQLIRRVEIFQPLLSIDLCFLYQPGFLHEGAPTALGEMAILLVAAVLPRVDEAAEVRAFMALYSGSDSV